MVDTSPPPAAVLAGGLGTGTGTTFALGSGLVGLTGFGFSIAFGFSTLTGFGFSSLTGFGFSTFTGLGFSTGGGFSALTGLGLVAGGGGGATVVPMSLLSRSSIANIPVFSLLLLPGRGATNADADVATTAKTTDRLNFMVKFVVATDPRTVQT